MIWLVAQSSRATKEEFLALCSAYYVMHYAGGESPRGTSSYAAGAAVQAFPLDRAAAAPTNRECPQHPRLCDCYSALQGGLD